MGDETAPAEMAKCILVVEDDAIVASSLVLYLKNLGHAVTWCLSLDEATVAIDRMESIDLAIVDFNLNGKHSTPILEKLVGREVFTVLCTGYDASRVDEQFRTLPRVEKPFTRRAVRTLLSEQEQRLRRAESGARVSLAT